MKPNSSDSERRPRQRLKGRDSSGRNQSAKELKPNRRDRDSSMKKSKNVSDRRRKKLKGRE